jgi:hypothetical protein
VNGLDGGESSASERSHWHLAQVFPVLKLEQRAGHVQVYRTMSHYSFCRIMALRYLMVEAVLPMTLTLNMFVHLEQEEGDKLIPLVMNLPGFKMTCSVSQHQVLFYCGDTINSYVISVLYFT